MSCLHDELERFVKGSSILNYHPGQSYIPFPSPELPRTPSRTSNTPRSKTYINTDDKTSNDESAYFGTEQSPVSSWHSASSDVDSPGMTVLLTPRTPPTNQTGTAAKGNASPNKTPSPTPKIIVTCPSDDQLRVLFPHMFEDAPGTRHLSYGALKDRSQELTLDEEGPVDRRVARVIQYEREPVEPMERESIRLRAAMREDDLVGLGLGSMDSFPGSFESGWGEDKEWAAWEGYGKVVRELDEVFAEVIRSGPAEKSRGIPGEASTYRGSCPSTSGQPEKLEESSSPSTSVDNNSPTTSSINASHRPRAPIPAEMVPLKTDASPSSSKTLKKRRSATLLKAKSSMDRLSRVFSEGISKTISALSTRGSEKKDDLKAEVKRYRRQPCGNELLPWYGNGLPTLPPQPIFRPPPGLKASASPSVSRGLRSKKGDVQSAKLPTTPSKTLRGRLPSFRLSFPRMLAGQDSPDTGKGRFLSPPRRNRCDSEESWGNLPLHSEQGIANNKEDSGTTVDFRRRDAGVHELRPVRSLHLLHQSAAWGAMRNERKHDYSSTSRPSSPSCDSLSMSVSDSSATMYNSLGLTPDIAEAVERYKQMARTESLAILEGKMQRRASLMWCEMALDRQVGGCQ